VVRDGENVVLEPRAALVVIDLQRGFDDPVWGVRNNPDCETHIAQLARMWSATGRPIVMVRHDSVHSDSPLRPGQSGHDFKPEIADVTYDLLVTKSVNSAFIGQPALEEWLREQSIEQIAVCGIQTNMCCETTARMGGNLGFDVLFVIDATATFGMRAPDGTVISADELSRVTATNLDPEFGTVVTTAQMLRAAEQKPT